MELPRATLESSTSLGVLAQAPPVEKVGARIVGSALGEKSAVSRLDEPQCLPCHDLGGEQRPEILKRCPSTGSRADHLLGERRSEERRVGKECRSRWSP